MWRLVKAGFRITLGVGGLMGIVYLPADTLALPETYPEILRLISSVSREDALIAFSGLLVIYLVWAELRPFFRGIMSARAWVDQAEAAQVLYDGLSEYDMVSGMVGESRSTRPILDVMKNWIADGIQKGIIKGIGKRNNRSYDEPIPIEIEASDSENLGTSTIQSILADNTDSSLVLFVDSGNNNKWRECRFKRKSLERYLKYLSEES